MKAASLYWGCAAWTIITLSTLAFFLFSPNCILNTSFILLLLSQGVLKIFKNTEIMSGRVFQEHYLSSQTHESRNANTHCLGVKTSRKRKTLGYKEFLELWLFCVLAKGLSPCYDLTQVGNLECPGLLALAILTHTQVNMFSWDRRTRQQPVSADLLTKNHNVGPRSSTYIVSNPFNKRKGGCYFHFPDKETDSKGYTVSEVTMRTCKVGIQTCS